MHQVTGRKLITVQNTQHSLGMSLMDKKKKKKNQLTEAGREKLGQHDAWKKYAKLHSDLHQWFNGGHFDSFGVSQEGPFISFPAGPRYGKVRGSYLQVYLYTLCCLLFFFLFFFLVVFVLMFLF